MRRLLSRLCRRFHLMLHKKASAPTSPPVSGAAQGLATPASTIIKPAGSTPMPALSITKPAECVGKPAESIPAPPPSITKPAECIGKPAESIPAPPAASNKPAESVPAPPPCLGDPPEPVTAPPSPAAMACAALRSAVRALCPPVAGLKDPERKRLGGLIFYGASHFVNRVSQILRERPSLSPDMARIHAEGLAGRQRRAACWAMVHGVLQGLTELANDCYLYEQGSAVEEAQQVIASYELALAQGLLKGEVDDLAEDALQIGRVQVLLQRVQRRQHQARLRGERRLREAKPRSGAAPPEKKGAAAKRRRERGAAAPMMDLLAWGRNQDP